MQVLRNELPMNGEQAQFSVHPAHPEQVPYIQLARDTRDPRIARRATEKDNLYGHHK